jgi:hypothetical protein
VDAAEQPPGSLALKCGSENNRLSYATQAMRYAERAGVLPRGCWKIGIVVAGLGAVHRLMDEVQIQSLPGRGTTVIAKLRF